MKRILFLLLILTTGHSYGQSIVWEKKFNDGQVHEIINKTPDSSFIVSGASNVAGSYPYHLVKYDWEGDLIWQKPGTNSVTGEQALQQTSDGGYIFAGANPVGAPPDQSDIFLRKYKASGDIDWTQNYIVPSGGDVPMQLLVTGYQNFLILSYTFENGFSFYALRKTDSLGTTIWYKRHARDLNSVPADMIYNRHGNLVLAGKSSIYTSTMPNWHPYLMELNQNGDSIRSGQIIVQGNTNHEHIYQLYNNIIQTTDGGYAFSGYIDSSDYRIGFVVKTDSLFEKEWVYLQRPDLPKSQHITKVAQMQDSTFLLLSNQYDPTSNKIIITRISNSGQLITKHSLNANWCSQLKLFDWAFLPDSSVVIVGQCHDAPSKAYIAKVANVGLQAVVAPIDTGTVGIEEELPLQGQHILGQSYPNPAKTEATIPYSLLSEATNASIEVHDLVKGARLLEYKLPVVIGKAKVTVDLQYLSSGVYLYTLVVDGKPVSTKKMVVIK